MELLHENTHAREHGAGAEKSKGIKTAASVKMTLDVRAVLAHTCSLHTVYTCILYEHAGAGAFARVQT